MTARERHPIIRSTLSRYMRVPSIAPARFCYVPVANRYGDPTRQTNKDEQEAGRAGHTKRMSDRDTFIR